VNQDLDEDERKALQSFVSASAHELDQHDDSESLEDEISNIDGGVSPSSSDDDGNSVLESRNAERNERILIGGSGTSTPR
jgi:hypothetical protein